MKPLLSIVVPVLDEAQVLGDCLGALQPLRARGHELIVVDGGSGDGSAEIAVPLADRVLAAPRGRAVQMNEGARAARHDILLFLHADTRLPEHSDALVAEALARPGREWGRFDIRLSGRHFLLRVIERAINWRSALSGLATGDQAIFVHRGVFQDAGGYPPIPLMEDLALSQLLRRRSRPCRLRAVALTSSRRWERDGVLRTVWLMWRLRAAWRLGADPQQLLEAYYGPDRSATR